MANPFEDDNRIYHALVNGKGEHALWPGDIEVPAGWTVLQRSQKRADVLAFIEERWTHMVPDEPTTCAE